MDHTQHVWQYYILFQRSKRSDAFYLSMVMKNPLTEWYVASILPPVDETINGKYRYQGWQPCIEWCRQQFGKSHYKDNMEWFECGWRFISEGVFEFQDEKMLLLFLLRWS